MGAAPTGAAAGPRLPVCHGPRSPEPRQIRSKKTRVPVVEMELEAARSFERRRRATQVGAVDHDHRGVRSLSGRVRREREDAENARRCQKGDTPSHPTRLELHRRSAGGTAVGTTTVAADHEIRSGPSQTPRHRTGPEFDPPPCRDLAEPPPVRADRPGRAHPCRRQGCRPRRSSRSSSPGTPTTPKRTGAPDRLSVPWKVPGGTQTASPAPILAVGSTPPRRSSQRVSSPSRTMNHSPKACRWGGGPPPGRARTSIASRVPHSPRGRARSSRGSRPRRRRWSDPPGLSDKAARRSSGTEGRHVEDAAGPSPWHARVRRLPEVRGRRSALPSDHVDRRRGQTECVGDRDRRAGRRYVCGRKLEASLADQLRSTRDPQPEGERHDRVDPEPLPSRTPSPSRLCQRSVITTRSIVAVACSPLARAGARSTAGTQSIQEAHRPSLHPPGRDRRK